MFMADGKPFTRDSKKLNQIKKFEGKPKALSKIFSDKDIDLFRNRYAELSEAVAGSKKFSRSREWDKQRKNEVIVLRSTDDLNLIQEKVMSRLQPHFEEEIQLKHAQFFYCEIPYTVHSDSHFETEELIHKTIVIPLEVYDNMETYTVVFDQRCYFSMEVGVGNKSFYNVPMGPEVMPQWVSDYPAKQVLDYKSELPPLSDLEGQFPVEVYSQLSVAGVFQWENGVPIVFDRSSLHCASALASEGIRYKYGLTLFTSLKP